MRVTTFISQEIEVDVSIAEFIDAFSEFPESEKLEFILRAINAACALLMRMPDRSINKMDDASKIIIANELRKQAERYDITEKLT